MFSKLSNNLILNNIFYEVINIKLFLQNKFKCTHFKKQFDSSLTTPKMNRTTKEISQKEFIILIGLMMALVALAIDMMLPALPLIGKQLGVIDKNDNQLIISLLFLGIAFGQLFYGPISDSYGRKPSIYIGFFIFIFGTLLSLFSSSLPLMLVGRFIQGFGIAGPRIISVALVRDRFGGAEMAKIMSVVMAIFIVVPILAPALGQVILMFAEWQYIFVFFLFYAVVLLVWFRIRMPESLSEADKHQLSFSRVFRVTLEILKNRKSLGYIIAAGFVSSLFLGYLNSSQQLFQDTYGLGENYAFVFALLALSVGLGSVLNGQLLVKRYGMIKMVKFASISITAFSFVFLFILVQFSGVPPLSYLLLFLIIALFFTGILFGNLNALAMEPLGHVAGVGSSVVGALSTLISVPFGIFIGLSYNNTVFPLTLGFVGMGFLCYLAILWASKKR